MPARISVLAAWIDGWRRVVRAPVVVVGLLALTSIHTVFPHETHAELLSWVSGAVDAEDADRATADAQRLTADTYGLGWLVLHPTFGLGRSGGVAAGMLTPWLFAPMSLSPPVTPTLYRLAANLAGASVILFLAGGVVDRLARGRPVRSHGFFAACGGYFFRFLRLGVPLGLMYWLLLRWLYPWLIGPVFIRLAGTPGAHAEAIRVTIYSVFTILLVIISVIGDYAMVRTVVEDRRSALGSLMAAGRFVRQRLARVLALYALTAVLPMLVFVALTHVMPRAFALVLDSEALGFLVFDVFMLFFQLAYLASATAFFQGELAHAQYTAAPVPIWPESPAVEAIRNLTGRSS